MRLIDKVVYYVSREIARPRVRQNSGWGEWPRLTNEARPEAVEKINKMSNMELLDIISIALENE